MSRLSKNDIKPFTPRVVNRISVLRAGSWVFASIPGENFTRKTKTQRFYLISEPFGLCTSKQNNPAKTVDRGRPGDYIAASNSGQLVIVSKEDFDLKYPKNKPTTVPAQLTSISYVQEKRKQDVLQKTINPASNTLSETYNTDTSGLTISEVSPNSTSPNAITSPTTSTRIY